MSIASILQTHVKSGQLLKLPSQATGFETARDIFVTPELFDILDQEFTDDLDGERLSEFRQTLDAFSEHGEFSVSENPDEKPPETMLARVKPIENEFWSIRVTEPAETHGIRAFGAFVDKDAFVILAWDYRELIINFDQDAASARDVWRGLFGDETPHSGDSLDEYLTNYIVV